MEEGAEVGVEVPAERRVERDRRARRLDDEPARLDAIAAEVKKAALAIPGVTDVRAEQRVGVPQELIRVDRRKAADLGVSVQRVAQTLETTNGWDASIEYTRELGGWYRHEALAASSINAAVHGRLYISHNVSEAKADASMFLNTRSSVSLRSSSSFALLRTLANSSEGRM